MYRSTITLAVLALAASGQQQQLDRPILRLQEEQMILEYTATEDVAVVIVEAQAGVGLDRVEIRDPSGVPVFELLAPGRQGLSLQGFLVETRESGIASLYATYDEGVYQLRARAVDGRPVLGSAVFSHELPAPPVVVFPSEGATDVPTKDLRVAWDPDPQAQGYRVVLEQDENDGLTVVLPEGSGSFQVPDGFLAPGTETLLEVGAIGSNGNCTLVEVTFTTL